MALPQVFDLVAIRHEDPLRWTVTSRTRPDIRHLIDLGGFGGNGRCSCEHFAFRIEPDLRAGSNRRDRSTRCGHIRAAREALCDLVIAKLLTQIPKTDEHE